MATIPLSIRSKGWPMKISSLLLPVLGALSLAAAMPAAAQDVPAPQPSQSPPAGSQPDDEPVRVGQGVTSQIRIAIPAMPTPAPTDTAAGNTSALGQQVAAIVTADLRNSELFAPIGPNELRPVA